MNDTTTIKCPPLSKPPKFQTPAPREHEAMGKVDCEALRDRLRNRCP